MNLEQIKKSNKVFLTCTDVSGVLKCNAYTLHKQAQQRPEMLGFPVICIGNRVKIPRIPFLKFIEGS
jgi:hypothetical protein